MGSSQICLLLWKNYLIRKRHRMILGFVVIWPIIIFMLLYTLRDKVDLEYNPTCQFRARLMPHDGLLPFVQSFICNVGNPCEPLHKYEKLPSFTDTRLSQPIAEFQKFLGNETIIGAINILPQSIRFLRSMAEILTEPKIKTIFLDGIKVGDLLSNHGEVRELLQKQLPNEDQNFLDNLFRTPINLSYILNMLSSSSGIDKIICSSEKLGQYLTVPAKHELFIVSQALCNLDKNKIPQMIEQLAKHFNFNDLFQIIQNVMIKFENYNLSDDVSKTVTTILGFETVNRYIPDYLKVQQWLPEISALFIQTENIDISFINKSIEKIDLVFAGDHNWYIARHGLYKLSSLFEIMKDKMDENRTHDGNLTEILDLIQTIYQDGVKLMSKLPHDQSDAENSISSQKTEDTLSYLTSLLKNFGRMIGYAATMHQGIPQRFFNILEKHNRTVEKIVRNLNSDVYNIALESFSKLDFLENLIDIFGNSEPANAMCEREIFQQIFQKWDDFDSKSNDLYKLLCSNEAKIFIADIYDLFEFGNFRTIVENILSTFINIVLSRPQTSEKNDTVFTALNIGNLKDGSSGIDAFNYTKLGIPNEWIQVFENGQLQGKKNILGYYLSIMKSIGSRSIAYIVMRPHLENIDAITGLVLKDLQEDSAILVNQLKNHKTQLLESFYLTISDINNTLNILEYDDFYESYCEEKVPPELIRYPSNSNVTVLKDVICRFMKMVQTKLNINLKQLKPGEITKPLNWTAFNQKIVDLYGYIYVLSDENDFDLQNLEKLKTKLSNDWSKNLTLYRAWEISIGLLCKFISLAESPLFGVQSKPEWQYLHVIAWSFSTILNTVESVLDSISEMSSTIRSHVEPNNMVQTQMLFGSTFHNTTVIIQNDYTTLSRQSLMYYIEAMNDHLEIQNNWPCSGKQSSGENLQPSSTTEKMTPRVSYNLELSRKAWKKLPFSMKVYKIFEDDKKEQMHNFNWTLGYSEFRTLIRKFIFVINSSTDWVPIEEDKGINYTSKSVILNIQAILDRSIFESEKAKSLLNSIQQNLNITNILGNHDDLRNHTNIPKKIVVIWEPLKNIVDERTLKKVQKYLPNLAIHFGLALNSRGNVSSIDQNTCSNVFDFITIFNPIKIQNETEYSEKLINNSSVLRLYVGNSELNSIAREIWGNSVSLYFVWLKNIIDELSIIFEGGSKLFYIASKANFQDITSFLQNADLIDELVNLIKNKSVEKFFAAFKKIFKHTEFLFDNKEVKQILDMIIDTLQSMEIFQNLHLLDSKFLIPEIFKDWQTLAKFLTDDVNIPNEAVAILGHTQINIFMALLKEGSAIDMKGSVCPQEGSETILNFEALKADGPKIIATFCSLSSSTLQNILITFIQNLKYDYIFKNLMTVNVGNILRNANLTNNESELIFGNIGVIAELLLSFKDKIASEVDLDISMDNTDHAKISIEEFLGSANEMMCGEPSRSDSGQVSRIINSIQENEIVFDSIELESLPTDFCRDLYKSVVQMNAGKIIWSYVKPLIRGRILYAPDSVIVEEIMGLANKTFREIETFGNLMMTFEKTLIAISDLSSVEASLKDLQEILSSDLMKTIIKSMTKGTALDNVFSFDFGNVGLNFNKIHGFTKIIEMLNNFMKCVLSNRMIGFKNEEELETEARKLMNSHEFLAGIIFLENSRYPRMLYNGSIHNNITYKIRMDVDYVPSTKRLKTQFLIPGPEDSFIEDLKYLHGFIQLQDSIDRAIIKIKTGKTLTWKTVSQQMPYPCWKYSPFQSTLYESQGLIVCFFFALMISVGSAVHFSVWERESQNEIIMNVMGLKFRKNIFAWFITTFIELLIVCILIFVILVYGKILPNSDPTLLFTLLMDYVFSIITFCYMISTLFSSASLAAVTAIVMFLLTYMPYVIVIAMESKLEFGYNLILCLSMSTSFSYGCLYTARREVQGVGLQWKAIWDDSNLSDHMSLGLIMIIIFLDGILYGIIGYFITKHKNSDENRNNDHIIVTEQEMGVRFEAVRKVYQTGDQKRAAIDDFTVNLRKGEITSLLGRNGAGKTTIIKILTGMVTPTCGRIYLNGNKEKKPNIGVCPQDNVLIDVLTPKEHMMFYAKLKNLMNNREISEHVDAMLATLELGKKRHEPVSRLSGGTKRRLCVSLAFLCSPQLVILDEPCAGVDPASRRRIWHLIERYKVNTTILLSTHHLDEAEMLSDTIIILNQGKILYSGSPLLLKTMHGCGYWINVTFPSDKSREIDLKSTPKFESLLKCIISNATFDSSSDSITINLPFRGTHGGLNDIVGVLKMLEKNKKNIGFSYIVLKCDTLDRIFLNLCEKNDTTIPALDENTTSISNNNKPKSINLDSKRIVSNEFSTNPSPITQVKALLKKRIWHFMNDWRAPIATLILPTIFVAIAMGFSLIRPPSGDEPPLNLDPELYKNQPVYFYSIDNNTDLFIHNVSLHLIERFGNEYGGPLKVLTNDTQNCACVEGQQICQEIKRDTGLLQLLSGRPTLDWIISTSQEYIEKRYGGWTLSHWKEDPLFVVWFNNKGHHSLPAYLNALNNAIFGALGIPAHLTTLNHPLKLSSEQLNRTSILQHVADVGIALVLLIAFNLVAAQGAKELVRERLSEEKRILYLAGVHPITYWTTALIWDIMVFLLSIALAVGVFEIFRIPAYTARDNLPGICLLLVLFSWASIPFTYIFEKIFDNSSLPNMVLFCLNTFIGVVCLATILVLDIVGTSQISKDIRRLLHNVLLLFPQYALGDALVQISTNDIKAELLQKFNMNTYKSPLGWDLIGPHYTFLFIVGFVFHFINGLIEYNKFFYCKVQNKCYHNNDEVDDDVMREKFRVENPSNTDLLKTINLTKEYKTISGTIVAVRNLSMGVQAGTCFGLLGINGAGKSTFFKLLTTELIPSFGKIILNGKEIGMRPPPKSQISYCPQTDALDSFLSPYQCLTIHGEVCGFDNVPEVVEVMLHAFDLMQYAHQRVSSLSGGNKRKLCVAISIMAPASVILMDEPTSGMDPASKELIACIIRQIIEVKKVVILSSHSVVELEKLCDRVGILVNASLRCIGTVQHLKHKFGESYIIFLRFKQPVTLKELNNAILRNLNNARILSRQSITAQLILKNHTENLSTTFLKVKKLAMELNVIDYTLTQTSLDQMLASFKDALEDNFLHLHPNSSLAEKNFNMTGNFHMNTLKKRTEK